MKNIIVVDMQKGFMKETNRHLIEKINNYLKQHDFDNIFFTKCVNDCNSPYTKLLNWNGISNEEEQEIVCDVPKVAKILIKMAMVFLVKILNCLKIWA